MADKTIPSLTAAGTLDGTELIHCVQGSNSRRTTLGAIAALKKIAAYDETTLIDADVSNFKFVGAGVTATDSAGSVTVTVPAASTITVQDEGSNIETALAFLNFVGAGVTATDPSSGHVTVTIPLPVDANITSPADGQTLYYDSGTSKWINALPRGRIVASTPGVKPTAGQVVALVAMEAGDKMLTSDVSTWICKCTVAPTSNWTMTIKQNGSSIGSAQINASSLTGTFTFSADVTFSAGDLVTIEAPGSQDATLVGFVCTIIFRRKAP